MIAGAVRGRIDMSEPIIANFEAISDGLRSADPVVPGMR
jgi:hypothetical protein